jgi:RimJ/RimL family protein N-acetyltransferase
MMLSPGTNFIEGRHIFLVPMAEEFVAIRTRWMNSEEIGRKLNLPAAISEESTRLWTAKLANDPTRLDLIIHTQENCQPVGYVGFRDIDVPNAKAEVYIGIGEPAGLSHGFEAVVVALDHLHQALNLNKIYTKIRKDNPLPLRIAKRLGATRDGVLRSEIFAHGKFHDVIVMSVLRCEFDAQRGAFEPYLKVVDPEE